MNMIEPIYVRKSRFGLGVFAARDIRKGETICEMAGEKIGAGKLDKISKGGRNILVDPLQIDDEKFINMKKPYVLVNHSCEPNAGMKRKNILVAIKAIRKGEEILYDYSSVWFEAFKCDCGSRHCRKYIDSFLTMPKSVQKKYIRIGIVPEFIKRKVKNLR